MANHPLQNMITRAVITAIDTVRKCQTAGLKLIAGEKKENVEHLEPYGFTSAAQNGAEAVVLFPGGDRSHGVAVVVADRRFRLKGLARGEVALYDDQGQSVTLTRAGIVINGGGKQLFSRMPLKHVLKCRSNPLAISGTTVTAVEKRWLKCARPITVIPIKKMAMAAV